MLKLTTDKHEASRGLSVTAELLVTARKIYSIVSYGRGRSPPKFLLAVPNVTAYPSTASVPTSYYSMWH